MSEGGWALLRTAIFQDGRVQRSSITSTRQWLQRFLHAVLLEGRIATIAASPWGRGGSVLDPCERGVDVLPLP